MKQLFIIIYGDLKWFVKELFNANGKISAPQFFGSIIAVFGCVLSFNHYDLQYVWAAYSSGMAMLGISGSAEVIATKIIDGKK